MRHCDKLAVTVNPTNKCNLRCVYCMASSAEEQQAPISINMDFARKGLDDAFAGHPTGTKPTVLRFFSPGEPTQAMDVIRECVGRARSLNPDVRVELQTNGLFQTDEDTAWIRDNIEVVWFSLDGPKEINDVNRPDAHGRGRTDDIEANMHEVAQKASVGVRSTVAKEWAGRQIELVEYYAGLGIQNLALNPIINPIKRQDNGRKQVSKDNDLMDFCKGFVHAWEFAQARGIHLSNSFTFNFDEPTEHACRSCIPMPQLNPDGSVSSCDMALYADTKNELQVFLYGSWDKENRRIYYDADKIQTLRNRTHANIEQCSRCSIKEFCAGGCAGRMAFETGNIYKPIPEYCQATLYLAKKIPLNSRSMSMTHP